MVPRKHRVARGSLLPTARPERRNRRLFSVSVYPIPGEARFSIVVPKSTAQQAVDRNRVRRRIYSVVERMLPRVRSGHIYVFFAHKGSAAASYKDVQTEIESLVA